MEAVATSRVIKLGVLLPQEMMTIAIEPPMEKGDQPFVIHRPSGAIVLLKAQPDQVTIKNTSSHRATYTLVTATSGFMNVVNGLGTIAGLLGDLFRR